MRVRQIQSSLGPWCELAGGNRSAEIWKRNAKPSRRRCLPSRRSSLHRHFFFCKFANKHSRAWAASKVPGASSPGRGPEGNRVGTELARGSRETSRCAHCRFRVAARRRCIGTPAARGPIFRFSASAPPPPPPIAVPVADDCPLLYAPALRSVRCLEQGISEGSS